MARNNRNKNTHYVEARSHYRSLAPRLHRQEPFLDARPLSQPRRPSAFRQADPEIQSDARLWRPETDNFPLTFSGTPARSTRLYDAPRAPSTTRITTTGATKSQITKRAKAARAQINRFGTTVDHQTRAILAFNDPPAVPVCHKRKTRREVLMAHGRGGSRVKRPRFNELSHTTCR